VESGGLLDELRSREELEVELGRRAERQQAVAAEGALQRGGVGDAAKPVRERLGWGEG